MEKRILYLIVLVLMFSVRCWADENVDSAANTLVKRGWVVHETKDFVRFSRQIMAQYVDSKADYVYDTGGFFFSPTAGRIVKYESYDRLATPRNKMYGDIVFITDTESSELIELRWFDGVIKHVIFNSAFQHGVTDLIPPVKNSLY
ncbi:MAG: hypothetical protein JRJ85_04095 [Deltaproteobacteria bacterium]|nr:hypothetical protein [Deltaproteobacteria bacterium]